MIRKAEREFPITIVSDLVYMDYNLVLHVTSSEPNTNASYVWEQDIQNILRLSNEDIKTMPALPSTYKLIYDLTHLGFRVLSHTLDKNFSVAYHL